MNEPEFDIDAVLGAPLRESLQGIADAIDVAQVANRIDWQHASEKFAALYKVAVAAQQVLIAMDNPPPQPKRLWGPSTPVGNKNLDVTTRKLRRALDALNA